MRAEYNLSVPQPKKTKNMEEKNAPKGNLGK